ncbi:hypothetical protein DM01DRAFT_190112 [Hesseltinella vesiculosa]|uniref:Velvet domain-containing protein n=1 Tax=Hesseltinella vesiculosa TaxID=101127 RepID=A0A1X2GGB1_9FUNG|nr:hypothetical protein DM01DRAFT_190112 [Hesseltinella vesiculosa]
MVVQSLHKLKGANSQEGAYFVFSDISVRLEGFFRLKFTLFEISGLRMRRRNSVLSNVFQVFSPKTFPESTELTQFLSKQGLHIRVRKASKTQSEASPVKTQNATTEWRIYHPEPMYESQPTLPSVQTSSQCAQSIMSVRNILISPSQRAPDHQPRLPYHTLPPPIPSLNTFHHPTRTNPQSASIVTPTSSLLFRPFHSK